MKSYYEEVKAYIEYCADIQHFIDGVFVGVGVNVDDNHSILLSESDGTIQFCEGTEIILELKKDSGITEMFNDVFIEIQDL